MPNSNNFRDEIYKNILIPKLNELHNSIIENTEITKEELYDLCRKHIQRKQSNRNSIKPGIYLLIGSILAILLLSRLYVTVQGIRCFVPNNYIVWEATRPISDCGYCRNIKKPLILPNMTREQFKPFAYQLQPIIVKNSISHWPAKNLLTFDYLKELYSRHYADQNLAQEDCQFLSFKSNFLTLKELFEMSSDHNKKPWYVGFSNCHAMVLKELRQLYPIPHFLPEDSEIPNTDYVFLGYEQGAVMHLDYIPRLMWQAQLQGNKSWQLAPTPECDNECESFSFFVEAGDAVLIDTRSWYHSTTISEGEFSLTIQSEYG